MTAIMQWLPAVILGVLCAAVVGSAIVITVAGWADQRCDDAEMADTAARLIEAERRARAAHPTGRGRHGLRFVDPRTPDSPQPDRRPVAPEAPPARQIKTTARYGR